MIHDKGAPNVRWTAAGRAGRAPHGGAASFAIRVLGHAYLLVALVLGPLSFDPAYLWSHTPPTLINQLLLPKVLVLCLAVALGVLVWLLASPDVRLARMGAYLRVAPTSLVLVALAIAGVLVSAFFATTPLALALTGSNYRLDGALIAAMWLALVPLTYAVVRRIGRASAAIPYLAFTFSFMSVYLLVQAYGLEPLALANPALTRVPSIVAATLGNSSLAGNFVGIGVVLFGILHVANARDPRRGLWGAVTVLSSAGVAAAGGRASQLSIAAAWLVLVLLVLRRRRELLRRMLVVSTLSLVAFAAVGYTAAHAAWKLATYAAVAAGDNGSFNDRLITWRAGIAAIAERPLFGYGADQAAETVWQHVSPTQERQLFAQFIKRQEVPSATRYGRVLVYKDAATGKQAFVRMNYDKAHDYFIDFALAHGVLALALFLIMAVALMWRLWRSRSILAVAAGVVVAYYLFAGLAWFATVSVDPTVWAIAGLGLAAAVAKDQADARAEPTSELPPVVRSGVDDSWGA